MHRKRERAFSISTLSALIPQSCFTSRLGIIWKCRGFSGHHCVPQVQRRRSNQQILERDLDALALLLAVDSTSQKGDLLRERIDWNVRQQFLNEELAACADLRRIRAMDSVRQLD